MKKNKNIIQPAWDLFCSGNLAAAEQAAMSALQKTNDMTAAPISDVMVLKAFYLCRINRFDDAKMLFGRVLEFSPDDLYAQQGYLLALKDGMEQNHSAAAKHEAGRLILGIGTGRSGSTTLTKLWQLQDASYCSHEHPPRLSWCLNASRLTFQLERFDALLKNYKFVGDVSHWWLPYIDALIEKHESTRIVVLKRNRKATVDSFLKIKGGGGKGSINHWVNHDGHNWSKNIWDECYPKYKVPKMKKALECYWDDYYKMVDRLIKRYPKSIKVVSTEDLSNPNVQEDLLLFCGYEKPVLMTDLYLNKGGAHDGERMY